MLVAASVSRAILEHPTLESAPIEHPFDITERGNIMRYHNVLPALLAAGLSMTATTATADELNGLYAGIGIGSTAVKDSGGLDDSDMSFKIFAGYSFNQYFAIELAYLDGGSARQSVSFLFPEGRPSSASLKTKVDTELLNLSVIGNLPLTESFSLFGKLGYARIETDTQLSFTFDNQPADFSGTFGRHDKEFSYGA